MRKSEEISRLLPGETGNRPFSEVGMVVGGADLVGMGQELRALLSLKCKLVIRVELLSRQ